MPCNTTKHCRSRIMNITAQQLPAEYWFSLSRCDLIQCKMFARPEGGCIEVKRTIKIFLCILIQRHARYCFHNFTEEDKIKIAVNVVAKIAYGTLKYAIVNSI